MTCEFHKLPSFARLDLPFPCTRGELRVQERTGSCGSRDTDLPLQRRPVGAYQNSGSARNPPSSCFDKLSTNGKSTTYSPPSPVRPEPVEGGKETYGTSGTRPIVRFFGGWNFKKKDCETNFVEKGYQRGVPMGGDLPPEPPKHPQKGPTFVTAAWMDDYIGTP
ncbi:MAG: DUF3604 domain-containing protein, partial [Deltaproteobacteria bacterium]|nr:DUF3604 domain-containing protein [Deltaproteobacteria bacterium]